MSPTEFVDPPEGAPAGDPVFAAIADYEVRHGPVLESEQSSLEAVLGDASALIALEVAGVEPEWAAAGNEAAAPSVVKAICVQMAYRAWSNPDGIVREQLGEVSRTYRGGEGADALYLTALERKRLRRAAGLSSAISITLETPYSGGPSSTGSLDFDLPLET